MHWGVWAGAGGALFLIVVIAIVAMAQRARRNSRNADLFREARDVKRSGPPSKRERQMVERTREVLEAEEEDGLAADAPELDDALASEHAEPLAHEETRAAPEAPAAAPPSAPPPAPSSGAAAEAAPAPEAPAVQAQDEAADQDAEHEDAGGAGFGEAAPPRPAAPAPPPAAPAPEPRPPAAAGVETEFTVFAPGAAPADTPFLIQVWLHMAGAIDAVRELAHLTDAGGAERPSVPLTQPLQEGARLEIRLDAPELKVDEPVQSVVWRGAPVTAHFTARAPAEIAGRAAFARVRVLLSDALIGTGVARIAIGAGEADPREVSGRRPRTAFLSYAREDLDTVLEHYQALKLAGLDVAVDLLELSPGERWERALYAHIERADVFFLYWSEHAAASEWVIKEAKWALDRQRVSPDQSPDIIPVVLETPPPTPPSALAHLHFDDPVRRLILGSRSTVDAE